MAKITLDELHDRHQNLEDGEVILDVRTPEEAKEARIPGSLNIPHDQVAQHVDELRKYRTVYIHCRKGGRAAKAFEALTQSGLTNVVSVEDAGMDAWIERGYAHTKG